MAQNTGPAIIEEIDYESLGDRAPLWSNMAAGAMAGISEHAVMYPVDSIKTRMQMYTSSPAGIYHGMSEAFSRIMSTEGTFRLWRGVMSMVLGAGPAHAVYFGVYEWVKEITGGNRRGSQWISTACAGAAATIASDALMNPFDVVKQRMQMHGSLETSVVRCFRDVYQREGVSAFYVSYPTTLTMTVPFTAVQFSVYEHTKRFLNPSNKYSPVTHITAGGLAGAVAAAATNPLDVCKTLLQTRGTSEDDVIRRARGMGDAAVIIWKREGIKGFMRGISPRCVTQAPSNALCWLCYEGFKRIFKQGDIEKEI